MKNFKKYLPMALAFTMLFVSVTNAEDISTYDMLDSSYMFYISAGHIAVFDGIDKPERYGIECRGKKFSKYNLIPAIGYMWSETGVTYHYAELKRDFPINKNWDLTPSLGVGLFHQSDDIDLGHSVEFRSGLELSRSFQDKYKLGVALYHLSNSRLSKQNPGTESLVVSLGIPFN